MKVSRDFGIVVRRAALTARNVDLSTVMVEFNLPPYFDESSNLISLGPFFGGDAADACMRSWENLGLACIDDFFDLRRVRVRLVFGRSIFKRSRRQNASERPGCGVRQERPNR